MKDYFSKVFTQPNALELATQELADAERELLSAQTAVDYAKAMVSYNEDRVRRLRTFINTNSAPVEM